MLTRVSSYIDLEAVEDDELREWAWREGVFVFKNHPGEVTLAIDYYKELFDLENLIATSTLNFVNIQLYAATRTAAIAAAYLGRELTISGRLDYEAEMYKQKLINREVRSRQSVTAKRKGLFRQRFFVTDI